MLREESPWRMAALPLVACNRWPKGAGAAFGLHNEDVAIGALDDEIPFPPDAAIVLVGKSPADGEFRTECGKKRGHSLLALGAGIRRGDVNPAGHLLEG